jgi:hypothetical protein
MAIFSTLQQDVSPMQANVPKGLGEAPAANALAGLASMFLKAATPDKPRAETQNEAFGRRVREYGEQIKKPNWTPIDASLGELNGFGKFAPEQASEAFSLAKTSMNQELLDKENELTVEQKIKAVNDEAWQTSPDFQYLTYKASELKTEEERVTFVEEGKAKWITTRAENARIENLAKTRGANEALVSDAWKNNLSFAQTETNILARGLKDLTQAISADPTASFNLDETGLTQVLPELRGTVVNQRNITSFAITARGALEGRYRREIASRTGLPIDKLGVAPTDWAGDVFRTYDATLIWLEKEVDPLTIEKRLEGEERGKYPSAFLSIMGEIAGSNPQLQTNFAGAVTGIVGNYQDRMLNGGIEEAQRLLKEASVKELIDARVAFSELVAVMTGESKLARTYEEVTQDQKDSQIKTATMGAIQTHTELQRVERPTRWNRAAWKQNFEVPAESLKRLASTDENFAVETSRFLSSDIMLDLGNLREAATPNGVVVSMNSAGQVVVDAMDEPVYDSANFDFTGVDMWGPTGKDKLDTFVTERKSLIDDINYKLTVLGRLGEMGQSTLNVLRADVPNVSAGAGTDKVGGGAVNDTLRGAGSGSTSSAQITYALPEAIAADTAFLDKVASVSSELGFDPNDLLRVIDFETAGSFSPKAQPIRKDGTKVSSATGLIQFLEETAKGLGTTTADLYSMTAVEQLDYVKKYFEPKKDKIKNFGDLYMAVHWPVGVGKDDSYVMYRKDSEDPKIRAAYNSNKSLDTNDDGTVTRGETLARLSSATGKGGNPTAGTPANENTVAAASGPAVQRAVNNAPRASSTMAATTPAATTEVAPIEATAALPEAIPAEGATSTQGAGETNQATAIDQDVQAFIQEIAGDPDKTYASEAEFVAAQEAGELEAGDTVVVNGEIYVVRKNGSVRRLGSVNS